MYGLQAIVFGMYEAMVTGWTHVTRRSPHRDSGIEKMRENTHRGKHIRVSSNAPIMVRRNVYGAQLPGRAFIMNTKGDELYNRESALFVLYFF